MDQIKRFGIMMKSCREELGLTLAQLGDLTGYSNPYLSQIETGKRKNPPSPELIKKLSEALPNTTYAGLLEEAGYTDLANYEKLKSAEDNFADDLNRINSHELLTILDENSDIKTLLEMKFRKSSVPAIQPHYNGHPMTEQDRQRALNVLKELFPEYADKE